MSDMQDASSRAVDVREAAAYLDLSKSHLDKLRLAKTGPRFSKLGRRVVYRIADLDRWLAANQVETTTTKGPKAA
jgi:predicted DNA-binding transcriptional regulator AlpA